MIEATFHATIPIMHLSALKDLRSTFEVVPKDTTLGKTIFLGLDNHLVALWSMCIFLGKTIFLGLDNHLVALWSMCIFFGKTIFLGLDNHLVALWSICIFM